ncbi:MAG: hypothetical protein KAQ98_14155, partial [Bacteriovoracaceae bacterium]|nr:hypothetical protein [Bacteriovoracaceae bacterium]
MKEKEFILEISKLFKRHPKQRNSINQSDSEVIKLDAGEHAFNIDDYSFDEDRFSDFNPRVLGHNLAVATISDLLATGAIPESYMHSITLSKEWGDEYIKTFLTGINDVLERTGVYLLGGDTSRGDDWKYTGVCFGKVDRAVFRSGAKEGDLIFSTGRFGAGNRMGLIQHLLAEGKLPKTEDTLNSASPKFMIRNEEAKLISKFASSSIDTSDGLFNSLFVLTENNPECEFLVDMNLDLVEEQDVKLSQLIEIPKELFLFGTLGEYEILFTVSREHEGKFKNKMDFVRVGEVKKGEGISVLCGDKKRKLDK